MLVRPPAVLDRSRAPFVIGQTAVVLLGIFVYFRVRGLTENSGPLARAHAHDIVAVERTLGINVESQVQAG